MFKICPNCRTEWNSRSDFLEDPDLKLKGYQVNFKALSAGIFLFNHNCRGTLAVYALQFRELYKGPVFTQTLTDGSDCLGHCRDKNSLAPCPVKCECSWVRKILQVIKSWPKRPQPSVASAG